METLYIANKIDHFYKVCFTNENHRNANEIHLIVVTCFTMNFVVCNCLYYC